MNFKNTAAGMAAVLLLTVSPIAIAQDQEAAPQIELAIGDTRPSTELTAEELLARIAQAQAAMQAEISHQQRKQLRRMIRDDEAALRNLANSAPEAPAVQEAAPEAPVVQEASPEAPPLEEAAPIAPAVQEPVIEQPQMAMDPEMQAFLSMEVSLKDLSDAQVQERLETARNFALLPGLSDAVEQQLRSIAKQSRAELQQRREAAKAAEPEAPAPVEAETPPVTPQEPPVQEAAPVLPLPVDPLAQEADKLIADTRSATDLNDEALGRRIQQARALLEKDALPIEYRAPLNALVVTARGELAARAKAAGEAEQQQQADEVDPRAERRAKKLLADKTTPERLGDDALRTRLEAARDLLSEGGLSVETELALRKRLVSDRAVLRNRVAEAEAESRDANQGLDLILGGIFQGVVPDHEFIPGEQLQKRDIERVLKDRRGPQDLTAQELTTRIAVYRNLMEDRRYSPDQRYGFRTSFEESRAELRSRYVEDRRERAEYLSRPRESVEININIGGGQGPQQGYYDDVWAAEADDEQIERQLIARPHQLPPQYSYPREDFMQNPYPVMSRPEVRRSLPAVELDTVHFGFNEAVLRVEQVANLDRLGRIIERILASHPDEVFMIEGHTDAVGSDAYNLALSRQRAESVRRALLEYYVIAPQNLAIVGLGERYLKIPTPEPEQENRRVSVRRVTPLMSGYRGD
jgi:outer membrane protein OmpA-like peptidoglycan-associated protein